MFHTLRGRQLSASAIKSAWRRARERALGETRPGDRPTFRDLRPKALSDGKRLGLPLEAVNEAAAHGSMEQTAEYMRGFETIDVALPLELPRSKASKK